jgi:hypothetical protein
MLVISGKLTTLHREDQEGFMRICIATYHRAHNYGAMLQAFALGRYLEDNYSAEVQYLNYQTGISSKAYRILVPISGIKSIKRNLLAIINIRSLMKKHRGFEKFKKDNFIETKIYGSKEEIIKDPPIADIYITGSDQVFRYRGKASEVYFLPFCKELSKPSIGYAPSFGVSKLDIEQHSTIKKLLKDIDYLSCREDDGAKLIHSLVGISVPVVVDPVFLLSASDWQKIMPQVHYKEEYILVYSLVGMEDLLVIAENLRRQTRLPIYLIGSSFKRPKLADRFFSTADPTEFLKLFYGARFVVTDSFHGTAFSLIFQKDFFVHIAIEESSSRIRNLLDKLNLSKRITTRLDQELDSSQLHIEYPQVNIKLRSMISHSTQYLNRALTQREDD